MRLLDIDLELVAGIDPFGEEDRRQSPALALADDVAHAVYRQRQLARRRVVRRRDRVEPWLQRLQRLDEGFGMRTHAGEFLQRRHHVERSGIAIGIFALRQRPRLLALRAAGDERNQFEQRSRAPAPAKRRRAAPRAASCPDFRGVGGAEQRDDLIDMAEIVAGEDAERNRRRRNRGRSRTDRNRYARFPFPSPCRSAGGATGTSPAPDCRASARARRYHQAGAAGRLAAVRCRRRPPAPCPAPRRATSASARFPCRRERTD